MGNIIKKISLLSLLVMLFLTSGSLISNVSAATIPDDFSGTWEISFFDASGKLQAKKTVDISAENSISDKATFHIKNVVYLTEISATLSAAGKVQDGELTDTDKLENTGVFTGTFTETEGKGEWKNYYNASGTWKAVRSEKNKR